MGTSNSGIGGLANKGLVGKRPSASEQAKQKGLTDRWGEKKARQLGMEMAKGGLGLSENYNQNLINALEKEVNIKEAGQKVKINQRRRAIFAGATNTNNNIFRRTLGGL